MRRGVFADSPPCALSYRQRHLGEIALKPNIPTSASCTHGLASLVIGFAAEFQGELIRFVLYRLTTHVPLTGAKTGAPTAALTVSPARCNSTPKSVALFLPFRHRSRVLSSATSIFPWAAYSLHRAHVPHHVATLTDNSPRALAVGLVPLSPSSRTWRRDGKMEVADAAALTDGGQCHSAPVVSPRGLHVNRPASGPPSATHSPSPAPGTDRRRRRWLPEAAGLPFLPPPAAFTIPLAGSPEVRPFFSFPSEPGPRVPRYASVTTTPPFGRSESLRSGRPLCCGCGQPLRAIGALRAKGQARPVL